LKAIVFGAREFACVGLEELLGMEVQVPLVVTYPRDPGDAPGYRFLADVAQGYGIPVTTPPDASGRPLLDWIRGLRPDCLFSFHYAHAIPRTVRSVARRGSFNLHLSLLPRWRGRTPIPFILLAGEAETGVTLHEMVEEFDSGDVVGQVRFPVAPRETATTLYAKSLAASRVLLRKTVPLLLQDRIPAAAQDPTRATVTPALEPKRHVDRSASVDRFDRTVRAFAPPFGGARTTCGDSWVRIWEGEPGEGAGGIPIPLADGVYRILRLSLEGKPETDWREFVRRHPTYPDLIGVPRPAPPRGPAAAGDGEE
jgi:UDP-4-amino-4-deoxy-L-arabinose formyltransferase/UDP-glucuronic acid dehydrogenase (UDP-4-keto-hexauronic acid decarboxylating)